MLDIDKGFCAESAVRPQIPVRANAAEDRRDQQGRQRGQREKTVETATPPSQPNLLIGNANNSLAAASLPSGPPLSCAARATRPLRAASARPRRRSAAHPRRQPVGPNVL